MTLKAKSSTIPKIGTDHKSLNLLRSILASNNIAHSYLFHGPRQSGKRAAASFFSQGLLCENRFQAPCETCLHCRAHKDNRHPDLLTTRAINGEQLTIDQARYIASYARLSRSIASKKIIVIEGADQMNIYSANSLLKILEEPPTNVIMILIADYPYKLLATVESRCQKIKFLLRNPLGDPYSEKKLETLEYNVTEFLTLSTSKQLNFFETLVKNSRVNDDGEVVNMFINALEELLRRLLIFDFDSGIQINNKSNTSLNNLSKKMSPATAKRLLLAIAELRYNIKWHGNLQLALEYSLLNK